MKEWRAAGALALAALVTLLIIGCGKASDSRTGVSDKKTTEPCQRIIALAPNLGEMVFALGLEDRLVGVGDYTLWPPAAQDLPRLGGLINPNLEGMISLQPDLAILLPSEDDVARQLRRVEVDSLIVPSETLEDIQAAARSIASRCDVPEAGEQLAAELAADLAPSDIGHGRSVLITVGRSPGRPAELLAAGPGTFLDQLIRRTGATNVMGDAPALYPQVSLEEVLGRGPNVIFELRATEPTEEEHRRLLEDWQAFPELPAVRNEQIHIIAGDWTVIPGPRLPKLYAAMVESLQP